MDYSRRQFLKLAAAGLPVAVASPLLFHVTAYGAPSPPQIQGPGTGPEVLDATMAYDEATAARIHNRSVEQQILKAGETPAEVKAWVDRRIRDLKRTTQSRVGAPPLSW